jgi:phytoene dehydrogenase-like protein
LIEVENGVTVYTDAGVSPVAGQDKQFQVNIGDNVNAWDGKQVYVQYQYTAQA